MRYFTLIFTVLLFVSCASIQVYSDFDNSVDFSQFKTFAFFKPQIDQVDISDLDKRRILKVIDSELSAKGLSKSETPDILIGFTTNAKEKIYVSTMSNFGWGWGWGFNPWFWGPNNNTVSIRTEGTLYINVIDGVSKQLIWQGKGRGGIQENMKDRDERIALFVQEIIENYPPISPQSL
ncbi:DUF4136 domain-containing protein [Flavobacteriaceae bacterium]|nr:DUF4136 domain-containing protein [Flavobacteriaceae bacterium]MDB3862777.1 DUF4136 domain-containing protein [Flavobacteriaceae bacterium]